MPRWNKARILSQSGEVFHKPIDLAQALVKAGLADVIFRKPLTIQMVRICTLGGLFGGVLVPGSCRNFLDEVKHERGYRYDGRHRTRKPRLSENDEYNQMRKAIAQEETGSSETTEEPLPDFQPTERLPADSAVAFPTDI